MNWPTDKESCAKKKSHRKIFIDDVIEWSNSCYDSKLVEKRELSFKRPSHSRIRS